MKIRNGFVSNSSSTSFTCDICGENVSGMDLGAEDAGMVTCENGHVICKDHTTEVRDNISFIRQFVLNRDCFEDGEKEEIEKYSDDELMDYFAEQDLEYELLDSYPEDLCPICRMENVTSSDLALYLLKIENTTEKDVLKKMREVFASYKEFKKYICGK